MRACVICENLSGVRLGDRTCSNPACRNEYRRWLLASLPVCVSCGTPLRSVLPTKKETCGSTSCMIHCRLSKRPEQELDSGRCSQCGVLSKRQTKGEFRCLDSICRTLQAINRGAELRGEAKEEYEWNMHQADVLCNQLLMENCDDSIGTLANVLLPHTEKPLAPPDQHRVRAFQENLLDLVEQAFQLPVPTQPPPPSVPVRLPPDQVNDCSLPVFNQSCGACRGKCCAEGNKHQAFVDVATIQRIRFENSARSQEDIINDFLQRLPDQSILDSCVFHTDRGCNLPNDRRADLCNQFLCTSLLKIHKKIEDDCHAFFLVPESQGDFYEPRFVILAESPKSVESPACRVSPKSPKKEK